MWLWPAHWERDDPPAQIRERCSQAFACDGYQMMCCAIHSTQLPARLGRCAAVASCKACAMQACLCLPCAAVQQPQAPHSMCTTEFAASCLRPALSSLLREATLLQLEWHPSRRPSCQEVVPLHEQLSQLSWPLARPPAEPQGQDRCC